MGRRGTKKMPASLKKLLGTHRRDRDGGCLDLPAQCPEPPAWLPDDCRQYWATISAWLDEAGVLSPLDQVALALLVIDISEFIAARNIVDAAAAAEDGCKFVTKTDKGNIIQHPAVGVANKAHAKIVKLLQEFGMTPAARAGLKLAGKPKADDPLKEFGVVA